MVEVARQFSSSVLETGKGHPPPLGVSAADQIATPPRDASTSIKIGETDLRPKLKV
jgi:hypothetical protein